jgi:hypothetical protein
MVKARSQLSISITAVLIFTLGSKKMGRRGAPFPFTHLD